MLFPGPRGNHVDLRNFRPWKPALIAAGVDPSHQPYDLRHTYATFALRAGVPVFAVSRFMGTSIAMIDIHYGHLAHDGREHAVALLDSLAAEKAVDARWTLDAALAKRLRSAQSLTPSLPWNFSGNWWQPVATVLACFRGFRA